MCNDVVSFSPLVQFNLLHSKFHLCSVPTRALLLSAYIKFINLFPEVKTTIQDVLRSDSQLRNADVELQQRAVEYLRLSCIASTDILVSELHRTVRQSHTHSSSQSSADTDHSGYMCMSDSGFRLIKVTYAGQFHLVDCFHFGSAS